jgi:hypothetical protein
MSRRLFDKKISCDPYSAKQLEAYRLYMPWLLDIINGQTSWEKQNWIDNCWYVFNTNTIWHYEDKIYEGNTKDIVWLPWWYFIDRSLWFLFIDGMKVEWVDLKSLVFRQNNLSYFKDYNHVFVQQKLDWSKNLRVEADIKSFEPIQSTYYAKDKKNVYLKWLIISGVDYDTFSPIGNSYYSKDKNAVYYMTSIVIWANPQTFEIDHISLDKAYDKDSVYMFWKELK